MENFELEESDDEYLSEDDLFIRRDENGELLPVEVDVDGLGKVKILPLSFGAAQRYFGGMENANSVSSGVIAKVLSEQILKPDLQLTGEDVENMTPMAPQKLLMAVMDESGLPTEVDVNDDGEATVALQGN